MQNLTKFFNDSDWDGHDDNICYRNERSSLRSPLTPWLDPQAIRALVCGCTVHQAPQINSRFFLVQGTRGRHGEVQQSLRYTTACMSHRSRTPCKRHSTYQVCTKHAVGILKFLMIIRLLYLWQCKMANTSICKTTLKSGYIQNICWTQVLKNSSRMCLKYSIFTH